MTQSAPWAADSKPKPREERPPDDDGYCLNILSQCQFSYSYPARYGINPSPKMLFEHAKKE